MSVTVSNPPAGMQPRSHTKFHHLTILAAIAYSRKGAYGWPHSPSRHHPFAETTLMGWAPIVCFMLLRLQKESAQPKRK